jgi:hypothetical protein
MVAVGVQLASVLVELMIKLVLTIQLRWRARRAALEVSRADQQQLAEAAAELQGEAASFGRQDVRSTHGAYSVTSAAAGGWRYGSLPTQSPRGSVFSVFRAEGS